MAASVVTFYSYKGGVGRSFALANLATILAQWGCNVLVVDWDIEAPGLDQYFAPYVKEIGPGVLEFIDSCERGKPTRWSGYVTDVALPSAAGRLRLMPAAAQGSDYTERVQQLDWDHLFGEHDLGERLEALRAGWVEEFDMILIDSRTGVTDFSGITTAQLPDILAFMFTANNQSLRGATDIARRAMTARNGMAIDRPALVPLPIPARFDQKEEYDRAKMWRARFANDLKPFLDVWAPPNADHQKLTDLLCIPYVARWTFGEELAAILEPAGNSGTRTTSQAVSYALETVAALLAHRFSQVDLLLSSREEFVHAARASASARRSDREPLRVFISYSRKEQDAAQMMASLVREKSLQASVFIDSEESSASADFGAVLQKEIERADAYIAIVGPSFSDSLWQAREIEWLLRQSLRSNQRKPIIPIVLKGGEDAFLSSRLADYNAVFLKKPSDLSHEMGRIVSRLSQSRAQAAGGFS